MIQKLTLPESTCNVLDRVTVEVRHVGLQLDKFSLGTDQDEQGQALNEVIGCGGDESVLTKLHSRRDSMLLECRAHRLRAKTLGLTTLHLARSGAMENAGIALHPLYGFVWLPGSGLKGMTRAWAETIWAPSQPDAEKAWAAIFAVFGTGPASGTRNSWMPKHINHSEERVGRVVFHDAWPVTWPKLERDIINNHHTRYYGGEGAPGDWEDPTLVSFLAVPAGTEFDFALSLRGEETNGLLQLAATWLSSALVHAGAGAKTTAGYGRFEVLNEIRPALPQVKRLKHVKYDLKLVTPAFLAGANQSFKDCTLRPATLRGLLRWWWRTMHAAHLSRQKLLEFEALVWGDTEQCSSIAVSLEDKSVSSKTRKFNKKHVASNLQSTSGSQRRRYIQGLFYVSYGLDERGRSRYYRSPGDSWELTMLARERLHKGNLISAESLLRQAKVALWLLARYGGVGSRSRKGFGSLCDLDMADIKDLNDCIRIGAEARNAAGFNDSGQCGTPSLEDMVNPLEIDTKWAINDYWHALDRIGAVYQRFIKDELRDPNDRTALGLPRASSRKQIPAKNNIRRHASPALWSVGTVDKRLMIRLVGFPSKRLPDQNTSSRVLNDLVKYVRTEMKKEVSRPPSRPFSDSDEGVRSTVLESGSKIQAILSGKTKKGGWRVKTPDGLTGHLVDSKEIDSAKQLGDEITVYVVSPNPENPSFRTKPVRKKKRQTNQNRGRGPHSGRRGSRRR